MITLTENAAKEIRKIMQEQQLEENVFIRVGVKGGGCSGFTYTFDFDARKTRFDLDFESQGMQVVVDKKSYLYIKDSEIDWSYSLMDRGLRSTTLLQSLPVAVKRPSSLKHLFRKTSFNPLGKTDERRTLRTNQASRPDRPSRRRGGSHWWWWWSLFSGSHLLSL